jgi:hypothetical protein
MYEHLRVYKHTAHIPVSVELLYDSGAITADQAREMGYDPDQPVLQVRWWTRRELRRVRWANLRERVGLAVGGWLAGHSLRCCDNPDGWSSGSWED